MKKFFLLAGLVFLSTIVYSQKLSRIQYIQQYKDIEVRQMRMYNIPASIILAQGCLESGNGNSSLAVKANNHFGIK
ncbi:MAG: glucosaminidase domain-containing protein, partial [Bacteroidales bacterium]|nr:glucosaminidase domain-containing protein [Bacteroidales bacterium]